MALLDVADDANDAASAQETPFGALRPPLGLARLKVRLLLPRPLASELVLPTGEARMLPHANKGQHDHKTLRTAVCKPSL